jgi:hypothetical protein
MSKSAIPGPHSTEIQIRVLAWAAALEGSQPTSWKVEALEFPRFRSLCSAEIGSSSIAHGGIAVLGRCDALPLNRNLRN